MTLPPEAKMVFEGKIFDVYQWEQKMFDGTTATFERIKRPDTVEVIPIVDGKILLADEEQPDRKRGKGLIGGRRDPGEEPLDTAKRELLEETGYESDDWELWLVSKPIAKMEWNVYFYIARDARKVAEPQLDSGERITIIESDLKGLLETMKGPDWICTEFAYQILSLEFDGEKMTHFKEKLGLE